MVQCENTYRGNDMPMLAFPADYAYTYLRVLESRSGNVIPAMTSLAGYVCEYGLTLELRDRYPYAYSMCLMYQKYLEKLSRLYKVTCNKACLIVDCSHRMSQHNCMTEYNVKLETSALDKAALVTAAFARSIEPDVFCFSDKVEEVKLDPDAPLAETVSAIKSCEGPGGGISSVFEHIAKENRVYDKIAVLSDRRCMQEFWVPAYNKYCQVTGAPLPYVYANDLVSAGLSTSVNSGKAFEMKRGRVKVYFGYGMCMPVDFYREILV